MKTVTAAWFEIAVNDMERAKTFYETIFDCDIKTMAFNGFLMGWFPCEDMTKGAMGTLIKQESYVPSQEGTLVYFNSKDVTTELDRVEAAGGKIYQKKTMISEEHGYMGVFIDTEGNRVALYSRS